VIERRLVNRAGRGVREASSEATTTTAKCISIRGHCSRKDRRKTPRMKVVFEESAVESPNSVMGYTQEEICAQVYRRGGGGLKTRPALGLGPLNQARNVTGGCTGRLHSHSHYRQGCRRPRTIESRDRSRSTVITLQSATLPLRHAFLCNSYHNNTWCT
jgi:hypothetical protein